MLSRTFCGIAFLLDTWDKIVMQCFLVGFRSPWSMTLVTCIFFVYTQAFRPLGSCVYKENTSDKCYAPRATEPYEKALHNYFIPCVK